jgi:iron complex outermembrane receptor protein
MDWEVSAKDSLQVSGGIYQTSLGAVVPEATISSPNAPPADARIGTDGGNVVARWQHTISEASSIEVRFSCTRMFRTDPQTTADIHAIEYGFQQHALAGSRHDVIWGLRFARTISSRHDPLSAEPVECSPQ